MFGVEITINEGLILKMRIYRKFWKLMFKNFRKMKKGRTVPKKMYIVLKGTF